MADDIIRAAVNAKPGHHGGIVPNELGELRSLNEGLRGDVLEANVRIAVLEQALAHAVGLEEAPPPDTREAVTEGDAEAQPACTACDGAGWTNGGERGDGSVGDETCCACDGTGLEPAQ